MADVVVIGAGLAGLICAQQLKQMGYQVVIVEKSRGLGGRLATRRLQGTWADHGVRYLNCQGPLTTCLIQALLQRGVLQPWTDRLYRVTADQIADQGVAQVTGQGANPCPNLKPIESGQPYYTSTAGLTAVAKALAAGLDIRRGQRVQAIRPDQSWQLILETPEANALEPIIARSIVLAVPAPQALAILAPLIQQGLSTELLQDLGSVEFDPCLSVIATYPTARYLDLEQVPWQGVAFPAVSELAWLSLEHTKQPNSQVPVAVLQSTATFAHQHLEAEDLKAIGQHLLDRAAVLLDWLNRPAEFQVHRWRYAFVSRPLQQLYLATPSPRPLVCCGDWCGGSQVENALESGLAAACQISQQLDNCLMPTPNWETHTLELMHQLVTSLA
jgi:predicted NAD/FAD-dependent oxidoreductase